MKDYLAYTLMADFGVASPLCSYVYITVNGEEWGLYLAVEAVEESFLQRNYGSAYGELYKPDSQNLQAGGQGGMPAGRPERWAAYPKERATGLKRQACRGESPAVLEI